MATTTIDSKQRKRVHEIAEQIAQLRAELDQLEAQLNGSLKPELQPKSSLLGAFPELAGLSDEELRAARYKLPERDLN